MLKTRIAVLTATLLLSAQSLAFELSHSKGTLTLKAPPKMVVTYDLSVLDSLTALGVDVAAVPRSSYSGALEKFKDAPKVGSLFEPDLEALAAVKPELIITGGRSRKAAEKLGAIAPTVNFDGDPAAFMRSFRENNLALAKAFGKEKEAKNAIGAIEKNVEALHKANKGKSGVMLFVINGKVMAHAPGDRFGYMHELTGLSSVLPAKDPNAPASPRPAAGSPEAAAAARAQSEQLAQVAAAEPDWLIVLDRGAINGGKKTAAEVLAKHPVLSQTRAFKAGHVHYVDPNGWYVIGGGLNNLKAETDALLAAMKKK